MLVFNSKTEFPDYYNYKIREFLTSDFYESIVEQKDGKDYVPDNELDMFLPEYLIREDHDKCQKIALDLYHWSCDGLSHHLDTIHELALYNFLSHMSNYDDEFLQKIYYHGAEDEAMIQQAWQNFDREGNEYIKTISDLREYLHDIETMIGSCFDDIDFISFPEVMAEAMSQGKPMPNDLLLEYSELIPPDIVQYYQGLYRREKSLFHNLDNFLENLSHDFAFVRDFYNIFWYEEKSANESKAQDFFGTQLKLFCDCNQLIRDREVDTGVGRVDFRVMDQSGSKVLIELKVASSPDLRSGFTKQLPLYMDAERCSEAYYVIFCFTETELKKARRLTKSLPQLSGKIVSVKILDASKKVTASKLR